MVLSDYDLANEFKGIEDIPEYDGHSGAIETSRILAIRSDLVKGKDIVEKPKFPRFMVLPNPEKYFPSGVMGDSTKSSKELGDKIRKYVIDTMVKLIEENM